jgi:hypothetical protein
MFNFISFLHTFALGNLYITDKGNHRIRKVTVSSGIITTIVGNGGTGSFSGDGGAATSAALYTPYSAVLDPTGIHHLLH